MIRNIIFALFAFIIVALVVLWVLNGGPRKAYNSVRGIAVGTSTESRSGGFGLPWQPENIFSFITEEDLFREGELEDTGDGTPQTADADLAALQKEYATLSQEAGDVMTFGNPSPHFRNVRISNAYSNPSDQTAATEYVVIQAQFANTAPVSLAGWSLHSAVSGTRVYISGAASPFSMGMVNTVNPVSLDPGASATLISGPSPVGVSFRENICSGYLSQFQSFEPPLSLMCPTPESELPLTAENLERYGGECIDYVRTVPVCAFPQQVPGHLSPACRSFVQTTFSYNGCVSRHLSENSFAENSWRLYFGTATELWRNNHDAIRLLDAQGQTVDVYVY